MIRTYFFVPLNNINFIEKSKNISSDFFIYDLEDSISNEAYSEALENIKLIENTDNNFIRTRTNWSNNDFSFLTPLLKLNCKNFVIPKVENNFQIESLIKYLKRKIKNFKLIILIENPKILFDLLKFDTNYLKYIHAIGLGSHDYCAQINARHSHEYFSFSHDFVLNFCYANSIEPIDVASMEIKSKKIFLQDVKIGLNKGYRSKFILHPFQLNCIKKFKYFSDEELQLALEIKDKLNDAENFNAIKHNGKIIELPHLKRLREILESIKK